MDRLEKTFSEGGNILGNYEGKTHDEKIGAFLLDALAHGMFVIPFIDINGQKAYTVFGAHGDRNNNAYGEWNPILEGDQWIPGIPVPFDLSTR